MNAAAIAIKEKYTYFILDIYKFFESERIEGGILLKSTKDSVDPFDQHMLNCGKGLFKTMECNQINRFYSNEEAEEVYDGQDEWKAQRQFDA